MPQASSSSTLAMKAPAEAHPFSIRVEPLVTREGRYSWVISQGENAPTVSQESYATRREALAAGDKVLRKMIDLWRVAK